MQSIKNHYQNVIFDSEINRKPVQEAKPQCLPAVVRLHGVIFFKSSYGVVFKRARFVVQRHTRGHPKAPLGFEPSISCLLDSNFNQLNQGALLQPTFFGST